MCDAVPTWGCVAVASRFRLCIFGVRRLSVTYAHHCQIGSFVVDRARLDGARNRTRDCCYAELLVNCRRDRVRSRVGRQPLLDVLQQFLRLDILLSKLDAAQRKGGTRHEGCVGLSGDDAFEGSDSGHLNTIEHFGGALSNIKKCLLVGIRRPSVVQECGVGGQESAVLGVGSNGRRGLGNVLQKVETGTSTWRRRRGRRRRWRDVFLIRIVSVKYVDYLKRRTSDGGKGAQVQSRAPTRASVLPVVVGRDEPVEHASHQIWSPRWTSLEEGHCLVHGRVLGGLVGHAQKLGVAHAVHLVDLTRLKSRVDSRCVYYASAVRIVLYSAPVRRHLKGAQRHVHARVLCACQSAALGTGSVTHLLPHTVASSHDDVPHVDPPAGHDVFCVLWSQDLTRSEESALCWKPASSRHHAVVHRR